MEVSPFNPSELYSPIGRTASERADLICPCGEEMVYPVAVRVTRGPIAVTEITKDCVRDRRWLTSTPIEGRGARRGAIIEVEFNCEDGDKFIQVFEFYEGRTHAQILFGHAEPLPSSDLTIWRA
jgi:hypothetical protein